MSSYLEKKGEKRRVVPQRVFYSDAIANAPLVEGNKVNIKGDTNQDNKLSWQVMTEVYSPVLPKMDIPPRPYVTFLQEAWKVAEEVITEEEVERQEASKRKKESLEVEIIPRLLLARKQVDYSSESIIPLMASVSISDIAPPPTPEDSSYEFSLMGNGHFLPIHYFDDTELDVRTPQEWLDTGASGDKVNPTYSVAVEALLPVSKDRNQASYIWVPALVTAYDRLSGFFRTQPESYSEDAAVDIPRIYIRFRSENPLTYKQRVLDAVRRRDESEGALRYENVGRNILEAPNLERREWRP